MKNLKYFEDKAQELRATSIDYKLIPTSKLILRLMKIYRAENHISFEAYKPVYDKWFNKYHN